jgi:hypothetical protein
MEAWGLGKESDDMIYLRMRTGLHAELFCGFPLLITEICCQVGINGGIEGERGANY